MRGRVDPVALLDRTAAYAFVFASVLLGAAIPRHVYAQSACISARPGLVSWWRGEGSAYDSVGSNHGTPEGGMTFPSGEAGQAFSLNGASQWVDLGPWMNLQTFSVSLWVEPHASQVQYADIMDNNHTGSRSWVIQQDGTSTPNHYVASAIGLAAPGGVRGGR